MDDFDYLNDTLNKMYWTMVPDPNNPKELVKRFKCTRSSFMDTDEFREISAKYPKYVDEFKRLILDDFGNTFCNIPSDILGYYCVLDARNTLLIRSQLKDDYSDTCVNVYLDNIRLGARLHSGGMYKDVEYHARYQEECLNMMSYGIIYSATVLCSMKMHDYESSASYAHNYTDSAIRLLELGEFSSGDVKSISKKLISNNLSNLYESGLDEPSIYDKYGEGIYNALVEGLKDTGSVADSNITRKKKVFVPINERLSKELGIDSIDVNSESHKRLEEYLHYNMSYNGFLDIWKNQMPDIYHIPKEFKFLGAVYDRRDFIDKVKKSYFPCTSPKEYEVILEYVMDKYKLESVFLSMMYYNLNKSHIKSMFDDMYKDMDINQAFNHFKDNFDSYPQELKDIANEYMNDPYGANMTSTFDDGKGLIKA